MSNMVKKIAAVGALLTLCLVIFGCTESTMGVNIDKETRAITLTADQPTNAVVTMDFEVGEGGGYAFALHLDQGTYRVKLQILDENEEVYTAYEKEDINSDLTYSDVIEPGTYTLSVLGMDAVGKFKIQSFDPADTSADEIVEELQEAVNEKTTSEKDAA